MRGRHWLAVLLLLGCLPGCQLTSDPPRARVEAVLPSLLEQVAQVTVYRSARENTFEPTAEEALRIAMASCVRVYCTPDEGSDLRADGGQLWHCARFPISPGCAHLIAATGLVRAPAGL